MQPQPLSLPAVPEPTYGERLKNKVVIITGAAQGIGEAIVACFQAQQARLVIADIQAERLSKSPPTGANAALRLSRRPSISPPKSNGRR